MARVLGISAPGAFALAVVLATGSLSCGGSKGPEPSTGDTGGGDGGSGDGSGGTTGGGGTDAGAGGSSGGTSGGSGGSGGTPSDGGSGGGTSGGGGPSSACAALVAAPDAGRARRFDVASNESCYRATSNPNGQVALGVASAGRGTGSVTFHLYPPDGTAEQGTIGLASSGGADLDPWFHWTSLGWAGSGRAYTSVSPYPYVVLGAFDDRGNPIGGGGDALVSSAPDGHGGSVMLGQPYNPSGPVYFGPTRLEWLDARGAVLRTAALDRDALMLLVNWGTDHVLVLGSDAAGVRARWYDAAGAPLTGWFAATAPLDTPTLHLLLDGTIALGDARGWKAVFRDGVEAVDPPPAWLAARPGTRLATIRGGRGYAVLPWLQNRADLGLSPRLDTLELVTPSGESCGSVTTPPAPGESGVTRAPSGLEVGQDGTVLATESLSGSGLGGGNHCEFRWWPALLR